jgi:hypothetical protein
MKNFFISLLTFITFMQAKAQTIPNGDFELPLTSNGMIPNWASFGTIIIGINDSIITDTPTVALSPIAASGSFALALGSSYNVTQNFGYDGQIGCLADSQSTWSVIPQFSINDKPSALTLYYRITQFPPVFFNDSTECQVRIVNSNLDLIGEGSAKLWQKSQWYLFKSIPITYLASADIPNGDSLPAFAQISFKHLIANLPHASHRILIDNLTFINNPDAVNDVQKTTKCTLIYPNPTHDVLHIESADILYLEVKNMLGTTMLKNCSTNQIDMRHWANGIYFLKISSKMGVETLHVQKQ